jgi:WD40 repeat protein
VVATGCQDGTARLWEAATGTLQRTAAPHQDAILCLAFSPNGRRLATGSGDRTVRVWDARTATPLGPPLWHPDGVQALAFSPDGRSILAARRDPFAQLWRAPAPPLVGDVEQIRLWAEVLAGMERNHGGSIRRLNDHEVEERRRRLRELGDSEFVEAIPSR